MQCRLHVHLYNITCMYKCWWDKSLFFSNDPNASLAAGCSSRVTGPMHKNAAGVNAVLIIIGRSFSVRLQDDIGSITVLCLHVGPGIKRRGWESFDDTQLRKHFRPVYCASVCAPLWSHNQHRQIFTRGKIFRYPRSLSFNKSNNSEYCGQPKTGVARINMYETVCNKAVM